MVKRKDNPDDNDKLNILKNSTLRCAENDLKKFDGVMTKILHWDDETNNVCLTLPQDLCGALGKDIDKLCGHQLFEIMEAFLMSLRNRKNVYIMSSAASLEDAKGKIMDEALAMQTFDGIKIKHWVCEIIKDGDKIKFADDINEINPNKMAINPETWKGE